MDKLLKMNNRLTILLIEQRWSEALILSKEITVILETYKISC